MADNTRMVPTATRYPIIFVVIIVAILIAVFSTKEKLLEPTYTVVDDGFDLAVVDGIFRADRSTTTIVTNVRAAVVPHHLVAGEAIALGIKAITLSNPKVVVVISPDHYGRCPTMICTTLGSYKTFFGDVTISDGDVKRLITDTTLVSTSHLFQEEHGVYTIVPFIKHYIPQATVVPVAISQHGIGSENSRTEMLTLLQPLLSRKDVALVISSDFSHYLPLSVANGMDAKTETAFCAGDSSAILALHNPDQSDCPLCLWIIVQEAIKNNFWNPAQLWHSNSATLLGDPSVKETTSHFTFALSTNSTPQSCLNKP